MQLNGSYSCLRAGKSVQGTPVTVVPAGSFSRRLSVTHAASNSADALPGPSGAFTPGQEAESRRTLFNKIAPVYDDVRCP